ncbi:MAG TPA: DUF6659 family protein [Candidatus Limnocylindrales bacterium]|nr:DUF6659 family protein [Candidatus Limnocylindrales bacterium]
MAQQIEVKSLDAYLLDEVEFVGLISKHGRLVDHKSKNNLNLTKQQKEMFFMSISFYQRMQNDYDEKFGIVKYTMIERENFMILSIPVHEETLIVVMNKNKNFIPTVRIIFESINLKSNF